MRGGMDSSTDGRAVLRAVSEDVSGYKNGLKPSRARERGCEAHVSGVSCLQTHAVMKVTTAARQS